MAKKDNMNNIETEIKAVAKAVTSSLKRQGHAVPHSAVLHAVAASLNRRDWHKLKTVLSGDKAAALTPAGTSVSTPVPEFEELWQRLSDQVKFWAAIAALQGVRFTLSAQGWTGGVEMNGRTVTAQCCENLKAAARAAMREFNLEGDCSATLSLGARELGTALFHLTGNGQFSHFNQKLEQEAAKLTYPVNARARFKLGATELECEAYGISRDNWYFPSSGVSALWDQVVGSVDFPSILGFTPKVSKASPVVYGRFWTDDHLYEVEFDAAPALAASHDDHLERILWLGTSDNECVDAIAVYLKDAVQGIHDGLNHVWHMRNRGDTFGFECQLDIRGFRRWMDANRPVVLARWFCDEEGVKISTRTSNSGESFYDWDYVPTPRGSEAKGWDFPTEEAALLDAYEKLGRQKGFIDSV